MQSQLFTLSCRQFSMICIRYNLWTYQLTKLYILRVALQTCDCISGLVNLRTMLFIIYIYIYIYIDSVMNLICFVHHRLCLHVIQCYPVIYLSLYIYFQDKNSLLNLQGSGLYIFLGDSAGCVPPICCLFFSKGRLSSQDTLLPLFWHATCLLNESFAPLNHHSLYIFIYNIDRSGTNDSCD